MSENEGRTPSAQCSGGQCWASTPNFECEYLGPGQCQTYTLGGGMRAGGFDKADVMFKLLPVGVISEPTGALRAVGITDGTLISHVKGHCPRNLADWGTLLLELPEGTELRIKKPGAKDWEVVTLK